MRHSYELYRQDISSIFSCVLSDVSYLSFANLFTFSFHTISILSHAVDVELRMDVVILSSSVLVC